MLRLRARSCLVALLLALPLAAQAHEGQTGRTDDRAGGRPGASTDKMGHGSVEISRRLAYAALAEQGIRKPTPEQFKAALHGGTVTNRDGDRVRLPGVLQQRASGMGWGEIAKSYDVKLGELMRHKHHAHHHHHKHHKHAKHDHHKHHKHADWKHDHHKHHRHADWKHDHKRADFGHERGDFHRARFERPERPHKIERPERPERPERHHRR